MGHPSGWKESVRVLEFMIEDNCPDFNVFTHDATFPLHDKFKNIDFDLIVLGPTFLWCRNHTILHEQISEAFAFLKDSKAVKVALPQDEYDGSEFLEDWLLDWKVDVTHSVLWNHWNEVYPRYKQKGKLKKDILHTYQKNGLTNGETQNLSMTEKSIFPIAPTNIPD